MGIGPGRKDTSARLKLAAAYAEVAPLLDRIGDRHAIDGEDIGQEAVVRMLQIPDSKVVENPARYLFRVARNLFVDAARARARERAVINPATDAAGKIDRNADPERTLAGKERLQRALAVIENLPPRCRQAFRLHRFDGLTYVAIAREMGISPSMVEKHIAEAMLRLGHALAGDES
jgi:RNA polymerase sigma-70 factor (ECF subfamily)